MEFVSPEFCPLIVIAVLIVRAKGPLCHYIESCDYIPALDELSQKVNLSPSYLQREFKKVIGITPRNYADTRRQLRFKKALKAGDDIALANYDAGYGSSSRLYEKSSLSELFLKGKQ